MTRDADKPSPKKERVLHTRIPAVLEAELKSAARSLRVPVSNLVRTILEDAVSAAERASARVEGGLEATAERMRDERERLRERVEATRREIVAYQPVVVAKPATCATCGQELQVGDDALLGISDVPGPRIFVCRTCGPTTADSTSNGSKS